MGFSIRSYDPNREVRPKRKKIRKRFFTAKRVRITLFAAAGTLLITAGALYFFLWNEGVDAGNKAQKLLNLSGIKKASATAAAASADGSVFPESSGIYVQPDAPEASGDADVNKLLDTELKGYSVIARLDIDSLNIHLPVLSQTSAKALKVSICYFSGPDPGKNGNLVITGHNYRSGAHFGKLDEIKKGDKVSVTDKGGNTFTYTVFKLEYITPDHPELVDDDTYPKELTMMTCQANGNKRLLVRCSEDS